MLRKGLVIYEPKGRAGEYAPLAINLYRGCGHGCIYCFAPGALFMEPEEFIKAAPRKDIIEKLKADLPKAARDGATGNVMLCFTCDPYQPIEEEHQLTRQAIALLHNYGFHVTILTKGGRRAERDFDLYWPRDEFATTLTFLRPFKSESWEPGATWPGERIDTLEKAHGLGIKTWVSLEPVIDPAETLQIIRATHTFVDRYKVGKINYTEKLPEPYRSQVKDIDWRQFVYAVVALLDQLKCSYYIKQDLKRYI